MIEFKKIARGVVGDFYDKNGEECSIQESTVSDIPCVWLGRDTPSRSRMHLTQDHARRLIEALQVFVDSGNLDGCSK